MFVWWLAKKKIVNYQNIQLILACIASNIWQKQCFLRNWIVRIVWIVRIKEKTKKTLTLWIGRDSILLVAEVQRTKARQRARKRRSQTGGWKQGRESVGAKSQKQVWKKLEKSSWQSKQLMIIYQSCFSEKRTAKNFDNWTIDNKYPWKFLERFLRTAKTARVWKLVFGLL